VRIVWNRFLRFYEATRLRYYLHIRPGQDLSYILVYLVTGWPGVVFVYVYWLGTRVVCTYLYIQYIIVFRFYATVSNSVWTVCYRYITYYVLYYIIIVIAPCTRINIFFFFNRISYPGACPFQTAPITFRQCIGILQ